MNSMSEYESAGAIQEAREKIRSLEAELTELRKYTGGGLREKPCLCGLISLEWYDFCPKCGRELPVTPSNDPPRMHVLMSGRTLCGWNWTFVSRKHINDRWISISDKENLSLVDCQGCKLGLEELGPPK